MVSLKDEEFNHFYKKYTVPNNILIGSTTSEVQKDTIELYSKSLAMSNDLERLPMIRAIDGILSYYDLFDEMVTSNIKKCKYEIEVFNGDQDIDKFADYEDEDLLFVIWGTAEINAGVLADITASFVDSQKMFIPNESSIIGKERITILNRIRSEAAVSGANFQMAGSLVSIEIDWKKVTKKQLKDYVIESWFRDDD